MLCWADKKPDNCMRNHVKRLHNTTWSEDCNSCGCNDGRVQCTKVLCPPNNCISPATNRVEKCEEGGSCVEVKNASCLRDPCPRFGQCFVESEVLSQTEVECDASTNLVTDDCAKVHLTFSKEKLPKVRGNWTTCWRLLDDETLTNLFYDKKYTRIGTNTIVVEPSMILLWFPIYVERNRRDCIYPFNHVTLNLFVVHDVRSVRQAQSFLS